MNIWEKIKKWIKGESEIPIWLLLLVFIVCFLGGVVIFSSLVFCYLGLEFADLRETVDSREMGMGGTNKEKLIERAFTIIGGGVAVLGLFVLIWRLILMGKQTKSSQEQVEISQKGQYSEQFLKSVEQTASDKLEICLGGLASLDALSREKKEEYRRVWEYLGEFLRHHKPLQGEGEKPHPKVNAIVKMLRERKREYEDKDFRLDLSKAHLENANLVGMSLVGVKLFVASLDGAHLWAADLSGAYLFGANLRAADLSGANLRKADLSHTNLVRADLSNANLSEAHLDWAKLEGALFGGRMKSGEVQDLTALKPEQLRGTFYAEAGSPPKLPDGISEADKPKAISAEKWFEKYR